jgi:hypothetical protein
MWNDGQIWLTTLPSRDMSSSELVNLILQRIDCNVYSNSTQIVSWMHRRSISVKCKDQSWISIKGIGWVHGPPWVANSPKDAELYFGLLDSDAGYREWAVSKTINDFGCNSTVCLHCLPLSNLDLNTLGITEPPRFKNGRLINPVALVTRCKTPLRVCDFTPARRKEWLRSVAYFFNSSKSINKNNKKSVAQTFALNLAASIICYQGHGAVNDTLSADNVTVAGEITDFEWIYVPGIHLPDGFTDQILVERQRKEAFYFIDVLISFCDGLDVNVTISDIVTFVTEKYSRHLVESSGFLKQMHFLNGHDLNSINGI